ncbi:hypothetical protein Scep_027339 [Stephania cephalantha]|uniref:Uncharacterized protein n=1 Tax=Stephania cephalantha TaxID=152367 RepID=A0AAP0HKP3_9MAGN
MLLQERSRYMAKIFFTCLQTFGKSPRYLYGGVWKQVNSVPPTETSTPTRAPTQSLCTHSKTKDF